MDYATVFSCTLIECIESIKSDVKKKIAPVSACDRNTKVTRQVKDEIFFVQRRSFIHAREEFDRSSLLNAARTIEAIVPETCSRGIQFSQFNFSPACASIIMKSEIFAGVYQWLPWTI
jgi:hypothetical protein